MSIEANNEKLGPYRLNDVHCGDAAVMMAALPDECIDLTVTSPPYDLVDYDESGRLVTYPKKGLRDYNGYTWDFTAVAGQLWRVTKQGGVAVWVVGDATVDGSETGSSFRQALYFMSLGFNLHDTMIYEAAGTGAKGSNLAYWQAFEYMLVFSKGQPKTVNRIQDQKNSSAGRVKTSGKKVSRGETNGSRVIKDSSVRTNIWRYNTNRFGMGNTGNHPAPFPEALARDHIISWSNPGDIVMDCFCGSGTTLKEARENGRRFLGFDISQEYVEGSKQRVAWAKRPLLVVS